MDDIRPFTITNACLQSVSLTKSTAKKAFAGHSYIVNSNNIWIYLKEFTGVHNKYFRILSVTVKCVDIEKNFKCKNKNVI